MFKCKSQATEGSGDQPSQFLVPQLTPTTFNLEGRVDMVNQVHF